MSSPTAGAPAIVIHAAPATSTTLNAFRNIIPPLTALSATGVAWTGDATVRHGGRRRKAALYGQREQANNNGPHDPCVASGQTRERSKKSMQRRAGQPELRDLLGGRERKLLEISLCLAHVLR